MNFKIYKGRSCKLKKYVIEDSQDNIPLLLVTTTILIIEFNQMMNYQEKMYPILQEQMKER